MADDDDRRITLSATQTIEEAPDYATFSTGVVSRAATAKDALAANAKAMRNVVDGLTALGIAGKDVQTAQFNVSPLYTRQKNAPSRIDGFEVRNQLSVRIRNLADVGRTIDAAAGLGANQFGSLDFGVSNTDALLDDARGKAIAAARRKAELYAAAAGAKLGRVLTIDEGARRDGGAPIVGRAMAMQESTPIASGAISLTVSVTVTWALE
ncbi:MAG: SIMPL domain-containing protein [Pseudomonadota bacterium]